MTEISELIRKCAIENAAAHGKAQEKSVLGKVLKERPDLRNEVPKLIKEIEKTLNEVNKMSKADLERAAAVYGSTKKEETKKTLSDLPNAKGYVIMRFAPNPNGPLHIGHARTALLNDEYVRKYGGKLILRLEDTDPPRVDINAYQMIKEDLKWLGVEVHEVVIQSKRLAVYRDFAARLIKQGNAYVCKCGQEKFKGFKDSGKDCPCRANSLAVNIDLWSKMLSGDSDLVLNLKTDMKHKNPAMRDFPIMRVSQEKHPLSGRDWDVYPLMNFSVTIDDHLLGMTHVIRGKDHIMNTERQAYIYKYLGWGQPEYVHNGLLSISGVTLSTSEMRKGIESGVFSGWDDPRLGTLRAMKNRGIQPEAIRAVMKIIGLTDVDATFEWENLYAENRKIIDSKANRYFFVPDPEEMWITGMPCEESIKVQLHPDHPERGYREIKVSHSKEHGKEISRVFITKKDAGKLKIGDGIRLKNFCNLKIKETHPLKADFIKEKDLKVPIIQWLPEEVLGCEVIGPEGKIAGFCETACKYLEEGDLIQFERFGFCRIEEIREGDVICYFAHG